MEQVRELVHDIRLRPRIELPKHWFGFQKILTNTTPAGWREAFIAERDLAKDVLDKENFERILKVVNLAEECGATNMAFRTRMEQGISGTTRYEKYMVLDEIWFPKNSILMMSKFQKRLKEIW